MLLDAVSTYSHSIILPWTPNRVIMIWLNPLWRVNESSKEVVRGWWWDNKTQRLRLSKQVWLLRWNSKRFVVKTLAPPVHRNLVDWVAVQILECMRKKVFALSICAFKFTVSENENVYAQFHAVSFMLFRCNMRRYERKLTSVVLSVAFESRLGL